jgi:hypothetical protein
MSSIDSRCAKRRKYPVELDGETVFVRSLTNAERGQLAGLIDSDQVTACAIGFGLMDDAGGAGLPQAEATETLADWIARIQTLIAIWPSDTTLQLREAIAKVTTTPGVEKLIKN